MKNLTRLISVLLILSFCICLCVPVVFAATSSGGTDSTTPTETTEPEESEEDKTKRWYDYLGDFIVSGFERVIDVFFGGIIDFVDSINNMANQLSSVTDMWDDLVDKFGDDFLEPVRDFFSKTINLDALSYFNQLWDFPIIKDILIAFVSICVVGGIIIFFTTV